MDLTWTYNNTKEAKAILFANRKEKEVDDKVEADSIGDRRRTRWMDGWCLVVG